jgi:hypothetical protein
MKHIAKYDEAQRQQVRKLSEYGINSTMYWAYQDSLEADADYLNFNDVIWDRDIPAIIEACKEEGIDHITISSTFTSLTPTIWEFKKRGCELEGMIEVKTHHQRYNLETGEMEQEKLPAFLLKIN